jgi:hypothetical protein
MISRERPLAHCPARLRTRLRRYQPGPQWINWRARKSSEWGSEGSVANGHRVGCAIGPCRFQHSPSIRTQNAQRQARLVFGDRIAKLRAAQVTSCSSEGLQSLLGPWRPACRRCGLSHLRRRKVADTDVTLKCRLGWLRRENVRAANR